MVQESQQMKPSKCILLVEDDPVFRATIEEFLIENGYQVISINNAADAMQLFMMRRSSIHMLISDICMPEPEDGIELIRNIRRLDGTLPIVVVTSYDEFKLYDKQNNFGTVIFSKPFHFEDFQKYFAEINGFYEVLADRFDTKAVG